MKGKGMKIKAIWTEEWPTARGWYWFYGQTSRMMWDMMPEYMSVRVHLDARYKPVYVANGRFLHKAEGARGLWTSMVTPEPPTDYQIEKIIGKGD